MSWVGFSLPNVEAPTSVSPLVLSPSSVMPKPQVNIVLVAQPCRRPSLQQLHLPHLASAPPTYGDLGNINVLRPGTHQHQHQHTPAHSNYSSVFKSLPSKYMLFWPLQTLRSCRLPLQNRPGCTSNPNHTFLRCAWHPASALCCSPLPIPLWWLSCLHAGVSDHSFGWSSGTSPACPFIDRALYVANAGMPKAHRHKQAHERHKHAHKQARRTSAPPTDGVNEVGVILLRRLDWSAEYSGRPLASQS